MNAVGRLGSYIYRGVGTVSGPFHPFGGAVDIIVVEQPDGTFKSSPWYVRFGKFQGVLKNKKNVIGISVNDAEARFHMYLDHTGQAYFLREVADLVGEAESLMYPLSSSDETAGQSCNYDEVRRPMKSKSCNYDAGSPSSSNGKMVGRPGILGFVFGRRSMKEDGFREGEEESGPRGVERAGSLERAEIAANLLEVKWSTNLDTNKATNADISRFSAGGNANSSTGTAVMQMNIEERQANASVQDNVEISASEISLEHVIDSASFGDNDSAKIRLDKKIAVSSEISGKMDEIPICVGSNGNYMNKDNISVTVNSCEASPSLQLVEEQRCYKNYGESDRVQSFNFCETLESSVLGAGSLYEQANTTVYLASEGNGEIYVHAESTNMTTEFLEQTVESRHEESLEYVDHMVSIDPTVEEMELGGIGSSRSGSIPNPQVQDENDDVADNLYPSKETLGESQSTSVTSIPHLESSEEEQFLFSDLDESKPGEVHHAEITYLDAINENKKEISEKNHEFCGEENGKGKETSEQNDTSDENPIEKSKMISSPITIHKNHEFAGEEDGRLVESLPNLWFPVQESDADYQQPLSHSLDSNSISPKWSFRKDESSSDVETQNHLVQAQIEHQLANEERNPEDSPNSRALKYVLANPELELSFCKHLLREGMGSEAAFQAFNSEKLDTSTFASLGPSVVKNDKLVVRIGGCYFPWDAAASIILGIVSFGSAKIFEPKGMIAVELVEQSGEVASGGGSWKLWPFSLKTSRTDGKPLDSTKDAIDNDEKVNGSKPKVGKKMVKAISPTSEQLASLNLKEGRNHVTFTFSTKMLGTQQVDARIYLWKWNTRIVISDVDGTITKSDVLGQFMPLVGIDWSQMGVAHLFSAIKENGYQLIFLSARAISQASVTRQFLVNLKQDGKALPEGPVVISPDGLFPSLFREVIRRAPHEFKIACLEDIRALFPPDYNPFYAGFGNRDTDEISYLKVGISRGKIFIINPKGEVAVNRRVDTRSYTSLHALVNGMFPATNTSEQEDFNSWNYWKLPPLFDV